MQKALDMYLHQCSKQHLKGVDSLGETERDCDQQELFQAQRPQLSNESSKYHVCVVSTYSFGNKSVIREKKKKGGCNDLVQMFTSCRMKRGIKVIMARTVMVISYRFQRDSRH